MNESQPSTSSSSSRKRPCDQLTLAELINRVQKYERKAKKWKELTDAVMFCLAKNCLPLYTVEKPGFGKLVDMLNSHYEKPRLVILLFQSCIIK